MSQTTAYTYCAVCNAYHEPMTGPCWPRPVYQPMVVTVPGTVVFDVQQEINELKRQVLELQNKLKGTK